MKTQEILKRLDELDAKKVKLAVVDIDGILRGKMISIDKFKSVVDRSFGFCNVIFGWDCNDQSYDNGYFAGWHTGYPDIDAFIDTNTFRQIPWDSETAFLLADFSGDKVDDHSVQVCPRTLLKRVKNQLTEQFGFRAVFSQEFEWFNFEETPQSLAEKGYQSPTPMTPGMFGYSVLRSSQESEFFNDLFDLLGSFGIPIEGIHTETGPGVYEAAIAHSDILEAGDRAVLFKNSVKEIASRHGLMASFMAKWNKDLPGCGGHVHQSIWDGDDNIFYDENDTHNMSDMFRSYLAGMLHCLPHILPMYAPNINSFKRLVKGVWAPTNITWGIDNRTVALRVLAGSAGSTRLECRVPGSDTNPYLVMAACLASGMYGIRNNMEMKTKATLGNGYEDQHAEQLPGSLAEATEKMKSSELANELFGASFVKHFTETREWECRQAEGASDDWEMKRYFEII